MSRTTIQFKYNDFELTKERINGILKAKKYKNIIENNENVWKCGEGFCTAIKYIKIEYGENNTAYVSGWIRPMVGNEQELKGFVGSVPKKQVRKVINEIAGK